METKAEDSRILLTMAVDYVYLAKKKKKKKRNRRRGRRIWKGQGWGSCASWGLCGCVTTSNSNHSAAVWVRGQVEDGGFEQHLVVPEASWFQPGGLNLIAHPSWWGAVQQGPTCAALPVSMVPAGLFPLWTRLAPYGCGDHVPDMNVNSWK